MNNIFRELITICTTYGQFIKLLDKNYGILNENMAEYVQKSIAIIKSGSITFEEFYNEVNIDYDRNKIIMYVLQGIVCSKNVIMMDSIKMNKYIDILNTNITDDMIREYIIDTSKRQNGLLAHKKILKSIAT